MYTELNDRVLWFDGTTETIPEEIQTWITKGVPISSLAVTDITNDIKQFNRLLPKSEQIKTKKSNNDLLLDLSIPVKYQEMDVFNYIIAKFIEMVEISDFTEEEISIREVRLADEYRTFQELNLIPMLKTIIYIINTLIEKNIVWGVGRGSSVGSYLLYIIGTHDIDSVLYDLEFSEFIS